MATPKLSINPVQQGIIEEIYPRFEEGHDDRFDYANWIAALTKLAEHIKAEMAEHYTPAEVIQAVRGADVDWMGWDKKYM